MKLHNDQPIGDRSQDTLNRGSFARNLANNINEYEYQDSLVVGLIGKWGVGKTSIINMMKNEIDENKVTVIDFNPWYFSGTSELISIFFEVLASRISYIDMSKQMKELVTDIRKYSAILKSLKLIPKIRDVATIAEKGLNEASNILNTVSDRENDNLIDLKNRINEELQGYKKVLVIIDEIDRLEEDEIKQIFKLVRAVGDFNNVIYVLSFAADRVLEVVNKEYLDKIINIPLYVPQISLKYINEFFIKEIEKIFSDRVRVNIVYWKKVYLGIFEDNFYNLRELNRFLNIIRFK